MDIEKAFKRFLIKEPFYGLFCLSLPKKIDNNITQTMCVCRKGINCELCVNSDFWSTLTDNQQIALLKHEMLHICFQHILMSESFSDPKLFNMAADLEVNSYIDDLPEGGLTPSKMNLPKQKGTKYYYDYLSQDNNKDNNKDNNSDRGNSDSSNSTSNNEDNDNDDKEEDDSDNTDEKNPDNKSSNEEDNKENEDENENENDNQQSQNSDNSSEEQQQYDNSKTPSDIKPLDSHEPWKDFKNIPEPTKQLIKNQIDNTIKRTAEECSKQRGTVPSELSQIIEKLNKKKPEIFNWKAYFRRMLGSIYDINIKSTRRKESLRFEGSMGIQHKKKVSMLVAIDTSASVSNKELAEFFNEIFYIWKAGARITIVECDADIHKIYEYQGKLIDSVTGRGGTDFNPPVDYYIKHKKDYASLIYFTDGECELPAKHPSGIIWIITSGGYHQDYPGKTIYIPKEIEQ